MIPDLTVVKIMPELVEVIGAIDSKILRMSEALDIEDDQNAGDFIGRIVNSLKETERDYLTESEGEAGGLSARSILRNLIKTCEEFKALQGEDSQIELVWKLTGWRKNGAWVRGQASKISRKERDLGNPHLWRITLSAPWWILFGHRSDDQARSRLVHHELSHLDLNNWGGLVPHDAEMFAATVKRFGFGHKGEGAVVLAAASSPVVPEQLRKWATDAKGQGLLFDLRQTGT